MYQIFSSQLGYFPFSVHFLLYFYGVTFFGTPNIIQGDKQSTSLEAIKKTGHKWI